MEKFYMLLVDGTNSCRYKHLTLDEAVEEATELLHQPQNYGKGITILKSISYGKVETSPVKWGEIE